MPLGTSMHHPGRSTSPPRSRSGASPDDELDHTIDDNDHGLKDTIRVNPKEIVEIVVWFTTFAGRYMYDCQILEHEDRDMMSPFVTMPAQLMPFMR